MTKKTNNDAKQQDLAHDTLQPGNMLTDNMGHVIGDDQNSLKAGERGPVLLEDHFLREKLHHFDHERIPERVVHARGSGAHGYFELTDSLGDYTTAQVLTEVGAKTPVFVRFSTVAGFRGSPDTPRDVRGFATRFYTQQGNWDIVGNNIPVFFIQDAIKFPDLVHAVKPEPHHEMPQAASAHDTFWDFISLTPESMHMIMWAMSDRAIPRSFDTMEGFGVHTFRLINARGEVTFVKFHWKPLLGTHSLVWDEAQKIAGKDPDFNRRQMWETIDAGGMLEWHLGVQLFTPEQAAQWDFDVLDATKIVPEDLVPVRLIGKMVLNRNPDNFFSETEQVGYMTSNIVPGMDFTEDPLLQGRNFSYLDTQLSRLGSPNWQSLPINRPVNAASNNQRDGHMRFQINPGRVSYFPNSLDGNRPAPDEKQGFHSHPVMASGAKLRVRPASFSDHYGQAKLFWNSMSPVERVHIAKALRFELSKVETPHVRLAMLEHLEKIHPLLASQVALGLGEKPRAQETAKPSVTYDEPAEMALLARAEADTSASGGLKKAAALSQLEQPQSAKGRHVAILAGDGVDAGAVKALQQALSAEGAMGEVVGTHLGDLGGVQAMKTLGNSHASLFDAVVVADGQLQTETEALDFLREAYLHAKPLGAIADGAPALAAAARQLPGTPWDAAHGVIDDDNAAFVQLLAQHRVWNRAPNPAS
ncbi:catalase [Deinococcus fonticola]|uniref:catalase n=1 Tax=Deinococcus fonticola TaxID=2528713 RepID=UPI0010757040|nr:catalase [Deinococcus fonticola]